MKLTVDKMAYKKIAKGHSDVVDYFTETDEGYRVTSDPYVTEMYCKENNIPMTKTVEDMDVFYALLLQSGGIKSE